MFGVAPTRKAARVLAAETGMPAETVAKLLTEYDHRTGPHEAYRLRAGTTLVVDESGMLGTSDLDRLVGLAQSQKWRLVLVGDPRQLQAVGRGGMFDELCRTGRTHELATVHRFTHDWERTATLDLRRGSGSALEVYETHGRIAASSLDGHLATIADAWIHHHQAGDQVAVTAETNREVDQLNAAIQARRREVGELDPRSIPVAGGETAGIGDIIQTRDNDHSLLTTAGDTVANRETWHVDQVGHDRSLTVSRIRGHGTATLPPDYVRSQVRLSYAATAHGHQGDTVDASYTLVSTSSSHRGLYVGATRGRADNHLMVVTDEPDLAQARDVLEYVLTRDRSDVPAIAHRLELAQQVDRSQDHDHQAQERRLAELDREATKAVLHLRPFDDAVSAAKLNFSRACSALAELERRQKGAARFKRRHFEEPIEQARSEVSTTKARLVEAKNAMKPAQAECSQICHERDQLRRLLEPERMRRRPVDPEQRSVQREALGL